ncbi:glycosyl transferase family 2 [Beutenbergia cavernae DSM 12333]|uniref:Glycosyl transferase family 2 n=1 Tax=Beutenbergia cavernae (strain ATCC BAA-8 / DSM 12333 / CCUG 43141 / JCM 11478 / NBRC 16432 / NCIMB 13614 / HKI 0122) TaxID=471853 RepID=C5C134_BEUC1|nr:glycosyltransferase family 2 protein [Beutenbergia cavernae]ACQ79438.1 glycosyl transferase family 2 [Beutenbergia cavernae DSM 12333]
MRAEQSSSAGGRPAAGTRETLSLVVPAFNEYEGAGEIVDFYRDIVAAHPDLDVELVVVDDGSSDGTADAVRGALADGDRAVVISLARNFGSHAAITAGLSECSGDVALTLSADRQEPLSAIADFIAAWRDGADIVWGLRSVRATKSGPQETFAKAFSRIFNATSSVPTYPPSGPSQILVSRRVIDVLTTMPETNRNVLAMVAWVGFDQREIHFDQLPRPHGVSKWTTSKKAKLVIDSFVEFSYAPIRWLTLLGLGGGAAGVLLLLTALVLAFFPGAPSGTTLLAGLILAVGGAQLVGIGILGEYLWRAGDDARRRPVYVLRDLTRSGSASQDGGVDVPAARPDDARG